MAVAKIKIKQATLNQLKAFAEAHLGIYFADDIAIGAARAQVEQAWGHDTISVQVADSPEAAAAQPEQRIPAPPKAGVTYTGKKMKPTRDMVTIFIEERDEPGGYRPVDGAVNGTNFLIQRGVNVEVPYYIYAALMDAVEWTYAPKKDGTGLEIGMEAKPRSHLRYPVRLVYDPRAAERAEEAARRTEEHEKINEEMEARKRNRAA